MRINYWVIIILLFTTSVSIHADEYGYELYANSGVRHQSAANYGRFLFMVEHAMASITLFDLEKRQILYRLELTPRMEKGDKSVSHCNQCCFSGQKYEESDYFPLLYVSQQALNNRSGASIDVLRILPSFNDEGNVLSFNIEQVQKIIMPIVTDQNSMGYPNAVIDTVHQCLYTYSRNTRRNAPNYREAVISKFDVPKLYDAMGQRLTEVVLTDNDIMESFPCDFNLLHAQGGFYKDGKIYIAQGYPSKKKEFNYIFFRVINLNKKVLETTVDMLKNGFRTEPEGCWFYQGYMMIGNNKGNIYRMTGDKYMVE